jgi:hypothetical protein
LLDTDVSWDVVKKIDSQIMKIRDIQKTVVDVKPFTEKDHLSIKDI